MPVTLSSNDGEAQFAIEFRAPAEYAHDPGFESSMILRGRHWDGDHRFPFSTSIEGIWVRTAEMVALRDHIARWLRQPLEHLIADDLSAEFQLARLPGQSIRVCFGPQDDAISNLLLVFSIFFTAGALRGEFHFVTDQSCLAIFVRELSSELVDSHEAVAQ